MQPTSRDIIALVHGLRVPLTNEKDTQAALEIVFKEAGYPVRREVHLNEHDIVDFMIGNIAIELKLKGQRTAIYSQLERYTQHKEVEQIILLTSRCMALPSHINGKPALVGSLSMGAFF